MQDSTRTAPRLVTAAAIALVVAALAAFAWFAGGATAGAAGTSGSGGSSTGGSFQPVQSNDRGPEGGAPADRGRDGHPCPEEQGGSGSGSGSSGEQSAPGAATPGTQL